MGVPLSEEETTDFKIAGAQIAGPSIKAVCSANRTTTRTKRNVD